MRLEAHPLSWKFPDRKIFSPICVCKAADATAEALSRKPNPSGNQGFPRMNSPFSRPRAMMRRKSRRKSSGSASRPVSIALSKTRSDGGTVVRNNKSATSHLAPARVNQSNHKGDANGKRQDTSLPPASVVAQSMSAEPKQQLHQASRAAIGGGIVDSIGMYFPCR